VPLLKWIDGSETHAWDTLEILFDEDKPGNFDIEHCEHDKLLYPEDTKHLQKADFLVRIVEVTPKDLSRLVKHNGFNAVEVNKILCDNNSGNLDATNGEPATRKYENKRIEKVFFKHDDGFVYVGWSCANICDTWLRTPRKLFLGQVEKNPNFRAELPIDAVNTPYIQLYETSYPFEILPYSISENECIMQMKGRVDLDSSKQEAATSLLSTALTSFRRSANLYWAADGENDGTDWD